MSDEVIVIDDSEVNSNIEITAYDKDGFKLTIKNPHPGNYLNIEHSLEWDTVFENNSDGTYRFNINRTYVNGWDVGMVHNFDTKGGYKEKDHIVIDLDKADITSFDEVEKIEFVFGYLDENYSYTEFEPVTVYTKE